MWQIRRDGAQTWDMSSSITVCIAAKFKSTSSSLSCVFDLSPLPPVLYCPKCAETLRRRLGLHEQRYVAVLLSAVNNDSRNAVLAATAVPHHRKTLQLTPLIMCFGSYYCLPGKKDGLVMQKLQHVAVLNLCTQQYNSSAWSASCTLVKT